MAVSQRPREPAGPRLELADQPGQTEHGPTLRAIVIGFVAILPAVFWGVYGDVISQTDLTSTSLMMPPVILLTALIAINGLIKKKWPGKALKQAELITIYIMLTVSVILSGMGMIQFLCTTLGAVPYYKTPENGWGAYPGYLPHGVTGVILPKLSAIDGFYKGNHPIPWAAWTKPIIVWSGFLFAMLVLMTSINAILRKQWMDREKLTFPIVQLPLEMTDPRAGFFSNRLMWMGFGVAAFVESLNSFHYLYPNVPHLQLTSYEIGPLFAIPPWNSVGYFATTFYPLAIGLGFVLSADVSFSCWFFYLMTKLENVGTAAFGWTGAGGGTLSSPPYLGQQGTGAFIGIAISVVWLARRHLKDVFASAFGRGKDVDDSREPMSYRWAVISACLAFAAMVAFCTYVGMSPIVAIVFLAVYIMFATTITRLRAVAGPPWTMGPDLNAMDAIVQPIGSGMFSRRNFVALAYFDWFAIEMRCCPMPTTIEGMKMAQSTRLRQRAMTFVMLAAIVLGIAVGFWACLGVWYHYGAATAKVEPWRTTMGQEPFTRITNYMRSQTKADPAGIIAMGFGLAVTLLLGLLRSHFVSFPFNPAGYVLANTGTMYWLWCPFLIAWVCKVTITRYGGIKGYRMALPFFLGLVLGDYVTSSVWALGGAMLGVRMYRCFPC